VHHGFYLQKWGQLSARRRRCEFEELSAPRHFCSPWLASLAIGAGPAAASS
jgi:hypothetical protein